uniref:Multidrug and toxin extrusion protein n=1 Tax=Tetraodon nigroviridis TaxID=99883 RepID=H3DFK4_TETNG
EASVEAAVMEQPSDRLFCCQWVRDRLPPTNREELYNILKMTGPLMLSRIFIFLLPLVVTIFCGRLGNEVIAGYGLAYSVLSITIICPGYGFGLACDTLMSQTFGSQNLKRVGVILQRGILILFLFCIPCWGFLINSEAILLCMSQDREVARIAQVYINAFLPAIPIFFLYNLQVSYLQNQGIILPQVYTAALAAIAEVATNYIFIYPLDLGVIGSAAANALTHVYLCSFLAAFIWWKKLHKATWGGWSTESLQEWGSFMKLGIPSAVMFTLEGLVYNLGSVLAGTLQLVQKHIDHILTTILTSQVPLGIQTATCVRVGNALGAGDTDRAIVISKMSLYLAGTVGVLLGTSVLSVKSVLGYMFTSDENIVGLMSHVFTMFSLLQLFDSIVCVCKGVFLGVGKQKIPAVVNLVSYYLIGLTLGLVFMFIVELGVFGFWLGLVLCTVLQVPFFIFVIFKKLNWKTLTKEAVERARTKAQTAMIQENQTTNHGNVSWNRFSFKSEDGQLSVGYRDPSVGYLSTPQLVLRRGLVLLVVVGLLAAGVIVHFLVPLP